jgi:hypothetical protein
MAAIDRAIAKLDEILASLGKTGEHSLMAVKSCC